MTFNLISPGVYIIGTFGPFQDTVRIFLLQHESECIIVELPPLGEDDFKPWIQLKKYITSNDLKLKFITASHEHWDHFYIYPEFHQEFPDVPIIVSSRFFEGEIDVYITPNDISAERIKDPSIVKKKTPIYCFKGRSFETEISGEPLYIFSTPKHSWGDLSIIFRGSMISGDWWLGPGDPNPNKIPLL